MKKKKYKLLLINPRFKYHHYGIQKELSRILGKKTSVFSLALSIIASFTPDHYRIRIINEEFEKIPFHDQPDLVGITTPFTTKEHCFEISDCFRAKGVPVVLGGYCATFLKEESLSHADSIVVGEAEEVWPGLLRDFEYGKLSPVYQARQPYAFKRLPKPRWKLLKLKNFHSIGVQVSRGCPYHCDFCIVSQLFGHKLRYRDIDNVIEEIKSLPVKRVFFVDDNLTINKDYARELARRLQDLKITWLCQSSIEVAQDESLLLAMKKAGCISILIGFESLNSDSLLESNKLHNRITEYKQAIEKIQSKGIQVIASFMVGFDSDRVEVFEQILKFSEDNNLFFTMISTLTAAPGTKLYQRMKQENRLLDIHSEFYNGAFPSSKYKNISLIDMYDQYYQTLDRLFSIKSMSKKVLNLLKSGHFNQADQFDDINFFDKFISSFQLLKRYYFTGDDTRKNFFKKLVRLGVNKIASWNYIAFFLLFMAGFEDYIRKTKDHYFEEVRKKVIQIENEQCRL